MSGGAAAHGVKVRRPMLPYGRQSLDREDIAAVVAVLESDWLTTGPNVRDFEAAFAAAVGVREAVAVSSGTAALHAAVHALDLSPGDEVIVPAITFAATANAVVYEGGVPVFADVDATTLLLDPESAESRITPRTRAVLPVDYAGQPCAYDRLRALTDKHGIALVADACHALGAEDAGRPVAALADMATFSLHPVKHITSGEGGVVATDRPALAERMRVFRNHGITRDHRQREAENSWRYEMVELGFNYRLTDFQCALAQSQLRKLPSFLERRRALAAQYDAAFADIAGVQPLRCRDNVLHAYHLYVVRLELERLSAGRDTVYAALREQGIGVNVHYMPVHLHPFYRNRFGTSLGLCPVAEDAFERLLTLPLFPRMTANDVEDVVAAVRTVVGNFSR